MFGLIEGFYGPPWSWAARAEVLRFGHERGLDLYLYGPKDDPLHRERWREPYPTAELDGFARLVADDTMQVGFAISPGLSIDVDSSRRPRRPGGQGRPGAGRRRHDGGAAARRHPGASRAWVPSTPGSPPGCTTTWPGGPRSSWCPPSTPAPSRRPTSTRWPRACPTTCPSAGPVGGWCATRSRWPRPPPGPTPWAVGRRSSGTTTRSTTGSWPTACSWVRCGVARPAWSRSCSGYVANPMVQPRASMLPLASMAAWVRRRGSAGGLARTPPPSWAGWSLAQACDGAHPSELVAAGDLDGARDVAARRPPRGGARPGGRGRALAGADPGRGPGGSGRGAPAAPPGRRPRGGHRRGGHGPGPGLAGPAPLDGHGHGPRCSIRPDPVQRRPRRVAVGPRLGPGRRQRHRLTRPPRLGL